MEAAGSINYGDLATSTTIVIIKSITTRICGILCNPGSCRTTPLGLVLQHAEPWGAHLLSKIFSQTCSESSNRPSASTASPCVPILALKQARQKITPDWWC
ncbi:hypothetical protein B0F90DRAFT_1744581 [Multifurca ochricompacta]|uniref:Uncharacterized protein n=1 Tax=Multifurca ochricompacta TaxID=376703 RepID=A0AAD4QIU8_9AGAM|nr:hypothetical protein B0F90DRAFT_1744581 [Multifurca ochricompacta]